MVQKTTSVTRPLAVALVWRDTLVIIAIDALMDSMDFPNVKVK